MTRLTDVNTTDITGAIELARNAMCGIFDPDGDDVPYFRVVVRPGAYFAKPWESHVPGRHLNALLNAEDAAGLEVEETYIEKFASACFYSYGGPVPFPLDRNDGEYDSPVVFNPHNIREGFHALNALVKYRASERAAETAAASIAAVFEYWDPDADWDYRRLEDEAVVPMRTSQSFITGVARAIGPLVKYYRTTGYPPALDLAIALKEKCLDGYFTKDGSVRPRPVRHPRPLGDLHDVVTGTAGRPHPGLDADGPGQGVLRQRAVGDARRDRLVAGERGRERPEPRRG